MSKKIYSVMLDDKVVSRLDQEALKNKLSRSEMLNKLIMDSLSIVDPFEEFIDALNSDLEGVGFVCTKAPRTFTCQTFLNYTYAPKLYIKLKAIDKSNFDFEIKIYLRTENTDLKKDFFRFTKIYSNLDEKYHIACDDISENDSITVKASFKDEKTIFSYLYGFVTLLNYFINEADVTIRELNVESDYIDKILNN